MNNVSPINTTMRYGAINGLTTFALFIILWVMGENPLGSWSVIGWALPILFTFLAVRDHRNKDLEGYITYGRGLGTGMLVAVFSGFLFAVLMYVFIMFIGTNIPQMQIDDFYANMEKAKGLLSEDKYESIMEKFEVSKENFTPANLGISSFESRVIGGLIISLIVAAVYKKNRSPFETVEPTTTTTESNPS